MFCWRKYNARQQRAYFKLVITDAENRRSRRGVTSGYIRQMAAKSAARAGRIASLADFGQTNIFMFERTSMFDILRASHPTTSSNSTVIHPLIPKNPA
jgi:hypothetical protein